jgi:SulP family sulfate permease
MLHWLRHYRRAMLPGDISAGVVVAMMMIPQGMAYALVAGLPPVVGIYASIVPPALYALFGTSSTQSVGPMAIISLMTASALAPLAAAGSTLYTVLAAQLALLSGLVLLACGLLRIGFIANFFSRPVMSGFTIGSSDRDRLGQVPALLGAPLWQLHLPSAVLGLASLGLLLAGPQLPRAAAARPWTDGPAADIGAKLAPMVVVLGATALVPLLGLEALACGPPARCPPGCPG